MDQNPEEPPLPPDRIHFLLPEGCEDVTDFWFPKWLGEHHHGKLAQSPIRTPEAYISVRELAACLGIKWFQVVKFLIPKKHYVKLDSMLNFATAKEVSLHFGAQQQ